MNKVDRDNLKRRYLIWFYKVTKESLDKIDRKFTQLEVDRVVYKKLESSLKNNLKDLRFKKLLKEFETYITNKDKDAKILKFGKVNSKTQTKEYTFLKAKLESTIKQLFGNKELNTTKKLYENEMTNRILQSKEY